MAVKWAVAQPGQPQGWFGAFCGDNVEVVGCGPCFSCNFYIIQRPNFGLSIFSIHHVSWVVGLQCLARWQANCYIIFQISHTFCCFWWFGVFDIYSLLSRIKRKNLEWKFLAMLQSWFAISADTDTYRSSHNWNGEDCTIPISKSRILSYPRWLILTRPILIDLNLWCMILADI